MTAERCDAVFFFRGDIRYDTRLANFAGMYVRQGKRVLIVQGAAAMEEFTYTGARVIGFANGERGPRGFLLYWLRAARIAAQHKATVCWACDVFSLPLAVWTAKRSNAKAAYDSRELFAHLGALRKSRFKQKFWYGLEKFLLPQTAGIVTSGAMDSEYMVERHGVEYPHVVRNVPPFQRVERNDRIRTELHLERSAPVCLYVGVLQEGRGIPMMLRLAEALPGCAFVFIGDGAMEGAIRAAAMRAKNVHRIPTIPNAEVIAYAASATLGFALIEPITLSYLLALPNKLFEYIMAGTPVIATFVPQIEKIIEDYGVGKTVPYDDFEAALRTVRYMLDSTAEYERCAMNCALAAKKLCWEEEEKNFIGFARAKGLL